MGGEKKLVDFVGNELHIGDKIVYSCIRRKRHHMEKTTIIGFTPMMIKIPTHQTWNERGYDVVSPYNVIKYGEADAVQTN